jgi:hypothetical protein
MTAHSPIATDGEAREPAMIDPTPNDIGRTVIYTPSGECSGLRAERGVITSINEKFVFVRFGLGSGKACYRANLTWEIDAP